MAHIQDAFKRYRRIRAEDPFGGRECLEEIQHFVDLVDETFVLKIPQADGIPYTMKFLPKRLRSLSQGLIIGAGMHSSPSAPPSSASGIVL
jgi:hypothetical protein